MKHLIKILIFILIPCFSFSQSLGKKAGKTRIAPTTELRKGTKPNQILMTRQSDTSLVYSDLDTILQDFKSVTYAQLDSLKTNSLLVPFKYYLINNYKTYQLIPNTTDTSVGVLEPLYVQAINSNTIGSDAISSIYYQTDIIKYSFDNANGSRYGYIISREDFKYNIKVPFDFRNVKFRRWKLTHDAVWNNTTNYVQGQVIKSSSENKVYICIKNNINIAQNNSLYWYQLPFNSGDFVLPTNPYVSTYILSGVEITYPTDNTYSDLKIFQNYSQISDFELVSDPIDFLNPDLSTKNIVIQRSGSFGNMPIQKISLQGTFNGVSINASSLSNTSFKGLFNNIFAGQIQGSSLEGGFVNMSFYQIDNCKIKIRTGYSCLLGYQSHNDIFSGDFYSNVIGFSSDNNINGNVFSCIIGSNFVNNVLRNMENDTIGINFQNNNIGLNFSDNKIGDYFKNNKIGNYFFGNTIDNYFGTDSDDWGAGNNIGDYFATNTIGLSFNFNKIGDFFGYSPEEGSRSNIIGNGFRGNTTNPYFMANIMQNHITSNTFGSNCVGNNIVGDPFGNNIIGTSFQFNIINSGFISNKIGNDFYNDTIGFNFKNNIIGNEFSNDSIGNDFKDNKIGNYFKNNKIKNRFTSNVIANYFKNNIINNDFGYWQLNGAGNENAGNIIGDWFAYNTIGYSFFNNIIKGYFGYNPDEGPQPNIIGNYFSNNNIDSYFSNNIINNFFQNNKINYDFVSNNIGLSLNYVKFNNIFVGNSIPNVNGETSYFRNSIIETDISGINFGLYSSLHNINPGTIKTYIRNSTVTNPVLYYFNSSNVMTFINL